MLGTNTMTTRIAGAVLCTVLALLPAGAFAQSPLMHGTTAIVAILALATGEVVAKGKTDENGRWAAPKALDAGMYTLQIGRIPATDGLNTGSITINIGGEQTIAKTDKGLLIDKQGGREVIMTLRFPSPPSTFDFAVGSPMSPSQPRTFTVTIVPVSESPAM